MNLAALEDLVLQSQDRVFRAQRNVSLQKQVVSGLQRDGRDTTQALDMLAALEAIEAALVEGRDRIAMVSARLDRSGSARVDCSGGELPGCKVDGRR